MLGGALVLAGCGSKSLNHAPVEDRGNVVGTSSGADTRTQAARPLPGIENAGKPGYYTVKPGDTLIRIGLETGQSHKDISRWNALENPNRIEVGQVIRVAPPAAEASAVVARPISSGTVVSTALTAGTPAKAASAPVSAPVAAAPAAVAASATGDDDLGWIWPGHGQVLAGFDEVKNKGVDISGASGDPVVAAAEGKVVYAGSGLRGYGNLIILKHNNTYLTAYAHNKSLLVKEDQTVKKGQKIAEMGDSDADRVKLHFEVRRQGKPVDPTKYLPAR
jgi:lipoprotein NlpD